MKKYEALADEISKRLLNEGIVVHRYDAFKTDSIYLKLDYGVLWSIRISDHRGYKHLEYHWNIGPWIHKQHTTVKGKERRFYPTKYVDALIADILEAKENKIRRRGVIGYEWDMNFYKKQKETATYGFWRHPATYEVKLGENNGNSSYQNTDEDDQLV